MDDYTKVVAGSFFEDGNARVFAPYKGWFVLREDGAVEEDILTNKV